MSNRVTFVASTEMEIEPLVQYLQMNAEQHSFQSYFLHGLQIDILISGIGMLQTTYSIMDYLSHRHPEVWIQAGIGGAFDLSLEPGKVYQVSDEMISGFGAENAEGRIMDQFELGWSDPDVFPFTGGKLICPYVFSPELPQASGMTTFYAHGHQDHIDQLRSTEHGQIENMEGASFFYVSLIRKIPFVSIRSVSNLVTKRDKASWKMKEAISALNDVLIAGLEKSNYKTDQLFRLS